MMRRYLNPQNPFWIPALGSLEFLTPIMIKDMNRKKRVTMKQILYTARYPMASSHLIFTFFIPTSPIVSRNFDANVGDSSQNGTFVSQSWIPGASMRQEMITVTRSRNPYMIREAVEFLQLGQRAQPAVHAVEVKQQARLVKLNIPPIFQSFYKYLQDRIIFSLFPSHCLVINGSRWPKSLCDETAYFLESPS